MIHAIASKDLLLHKREALLKGLFIIVILLVVGSLLTGIQRYAVFDKERSAALQTDKRVWMNQGDRNPHSAAHFSRYAFRPAAPLGLIDPGIVDFAGMAIWMEAHYQDPAVFRNAEDGGGQSRYAKLSPAFTVITIAPLLVFLMLFSSIAGEREDGTLRQLLASGVSPQQFFMGKLTAGLKLTQLVFTLVFIPVALASLIFSSASANLDSVLRLGMLYITYSVYLIIMVAVAIGVSALFRTRQSAFLGLTFLWAVMTIIVPSFAMDIAKVVYPQPDARESTAQLRNASSAYYNDEERQQRIEQEILQEYGVTNTEDLPINYSAYVLQVSEDLSEPEFDRFYQELEKHHEAQEFVVRGFVPLSPALAVTRLSSGIAGTDREHQQDFARAAEIHRRDMIQLLNEDYMYNADNSGAYYTAGAELWSKFEDLDYSVPAISHLAISYLWDAILLIIWLCVAVSGSRMLVTRAVRGEVTAL